MDDLTQTQRFPTDKPLVAPSGYNDLSGQTLGGYRLVKKLAQGGMGVIYEAVQIKLSRKVALKILSEPLANRPEFLQRFEREAKATAALNHPNIVQVYDFGEADGRHYIIMEFVEGDNLANYVAQNGKIPIENALAIVEQAALALKAAFEKSIVHRDIKPSNLMITSDGRIKVADMGLAKILTEDSELTMSSISIGSPHFIAPEQASSSKTTDHRADIYSLGVTLLYLVTGKYAYDGDSPISIVLAHATKPLPSGAELGTDLPPEIESFIRHMAAKNPDQRYQNYDELQADLNLIKRGYQPSHAPVSLVQPLKHSKIQLVVAVSLAVMLIVAATAYLTSKVFKHSSQPVATTTAASLGSQLATQQPGNSGGQPPMSQGRSFYQPGQQGFGFNGQNNFTPRFPVPMGALPQMPRGNLIPAGSVDTMLAAADNYAKENPTNYLGIIARYRIVQQIAYGYIMEGSVDPAEGQVIQARMQTWLANQYSVASPVITQYTAKMQSALTNAGPLAAYNVWKDFPPNLRSRESDFQIMKILNQTLPSSFQLPGQNGTNSPAQDNGMFPPSGPDGQGQGQGFGQGPGQGPFGGQPQGPP